MRAVKALLKRAIGNQRLTFEELYTVICQIEACVNSRPITPISSDANDMEPLTLAHFLVGRPLPAIPEPVEDVPISIGQWCRMLQQIVSSSWKRWRLEYLSTLQRLRQEVSGLGEGMVVVLKEETSPSQWRLGRIVRVLPDKVGRVRLVELRMKDGTVRRHVKSIVSLLED